MERRTEILRSNRALALLFLLLAGTICNGMIVPFMPFYIVEGLGGEPWKISLYSGAVVLLTVLVNRQSGRLLDNGAPFRPFLVGSAVALMVACAAAYLVPSYWTVLVICSVGFGLSSTFMAVMFTLGHKFADQSGVDSARFNAYLRATTSTAWMIGPALTFTLVDNVGLSEVFLAVLVFGAVRLLTSILAVPKDLVGGKDQDRTEGDADTSFNAPLWQAVAACFLLSLAHSLCFVALPLYYTQEVHLPDFAPGLAFSVKTAVEVLVISTTPFLMERYSKRNILLGAALLALIAIFALSQVSNLTTMILAQVLEGAYYGVYASVGVSFVQGYARGRIGHATSLYVNTLVTTGIIAGPAVGLIGQFFSFKLAIEISAIFALVAVLTFAFTQGRKIRPA